MKILNSFHDTFVKYSSEMVQFLFDTEGREQTDLQEVIWEKTLDVALGKKLSFLNVTKILLLLKANYCRLFF